MNTTLLSVDKDPMGTAIADYYKRHKAERLRVSPHSSMRMKFR